MSTDSLLPNENDALLVVESHRVQRSPSIAALACALAKAQGEIAGASKDKTNPHFKSAYADLASVWDACRPALSKNGLAVLQPVAAEGSRVIVTTILTHSSGEWIGGELTMTAQQNTPQGIGSCITYARRYALASMVGVAPEDDDGNAASHGQRPADARAETIVKPKGYDDLADDLETVAQEDIDKAREVFKGWPEAAREYFTKADKARYEKFVKAASAKKDKAA